MKLIIGVLIGAALVGGATFLLGESPEKMPVEMESTIVPNAISLDGTIAGIGYVEPVKEVRRLGFKIDGRIAQCRVDVGSKAIQGEAIVQLDDSEQQAVVQVAKAEVESAKARLQEVLAGSHPSAIEAAEFQLQQAVLVAEHAVREADRLQSLRENKGTSEKEADTAQSHAKQMTAAAAAAQAELNRLKAIPRPEEKATAEALLQLATARLSQANVRLEETVLRASFDGTVLEVFKREGDIVRTIETEPVLLLANVEKLRVRAEVDERFVHGLKVGALAEVYGRPLGDHVYKGTVAGIKEIMGPKTVFSRAAAERVDLDVVQLFIDMPVDFKAPVGLRVDVRILTNDGH